MKVANVGDDRFVGRDQVVSSAKCFTKTQLACVGWSWSMMIGACGHVGQAYRS